MDAKTHKARALMAYLVAGARSGDEKALAQLVGLVTPRLLTHATRLLGEAEMARDMVQGTWVDILRGLNTLRDDHAFLPWALRIVSRKVAGEIRVRQKDRQAARDYAAETDNQTPDRTETADAATIRAALDDLSPDQRAAIALFYLEDMSVAEVAIALDVPPGTVKTRLMHARTKLRGLLEGTLK